MLNVAQATGSASPRKTTVTRHTHQVSQVLWRVLGMNIFVAFAKISVGLITGSISMVADGFHSAMDASSNIIGLVGATFASRPPDDDHPYGHQKYETFATLGIGFLLLLTSWNVLQSVIDRFWQKSTPEVTALSIIVMLLTIGINLAVVAYEQQAGKRLKSDLLTADAAHTKSDVFVSLSVLGSLIAVKLGWFWLDTMVALVIVLVIARTGLQIVRRASAVLSDCAVISTTQVEKVVLTIEGIQSCHKIRSRGTEQMMHLDLHIQVDGQIPLKEAHNLGHLAQDRLKTELQVADVIVHVEPA